MAPTPEDVYERIRGALGAHDQAEVLEILRQALACPVCGSAMTSVCMACRGRAGGSRLTPAKLRQLKRAARKLRPGRKKAADDAPPSERG